MEGVRELAGGQIITSEVTSLILSWRLGLLTPSPMHYPSEGHYLFLEAANF